MKHEFQALHNYTQRSLCNVLKSGTTMHPLAPRTSSLDLQSLASSFGQTWHEMQCSSRAPPKPPKQCSPASSFQKDPLLVGVLHHIFFFDDNRNNICKLLGSIFQCNYKLDAIKDLPHEAGRLDVD